MKLMVPVAGIVFAGGVCCCGDFSDEFKKGFEEGMSEAVQEAAKDNDVTVTTPDGTTVKVGGDAPVTATASAGGMGAVSGTCGRFKDLGVMAPSGFSIMACSDTTGSASLVLQGSGDPIEACKPMKDWVEGKGYTVQFSGNAMGTASVVSMKGSERFVVACTSSGGQTLISYALSAG